MARTVTIIRTEPSGRQWQEAISEAEYRKGGYEIAPGEANTVDAPPDGLLGDDATDGAQEPAGEDEADPVSDTGEDDDANPDAPVLDRASLEAKAAEMGVRVTWNMTDETLRSRIADAEAGSTADAGETAADKPDSAE